VVRPQAYYDPYNTRTYITTQLARAVCRQQPWRARRRIVAVVAVAATTATTTTTTTTVTPRPRALVTFRYRYRAQPDAAAAAADDDDDEVVTFLPRTTRRPSRTSETRAPQFYVISSSCISQ